MSDTAGHKLEEILEDGIDDLAKTVLYDLTKWEFEQLAKRDPSFDDVAKECRLILSQVEEFAQNKTIQSFKELVEILESIALSIVDRDTKLLIDCTTHLQEFIEIRANGEQNHE